MRLPLKLCLCAALLLLIAVLAIGEWILSVRDRKWAALEARVDALAREFDAPPLERLPLGRRLLPGNAWDDYVEAEASPPDKGMRIFNPIFHWLRRDSKAKPSEAEALMAEFSITHLRRTPAMALSGGERRRCEIARALATQPHFILLDEPLAGIDPIALADIRDLVAHLKDRGIGVLITDHNVRETLEIVDRAYILHEGRVLMEGTPAEIVVDADVRRVYLGERFSL